MNRIALETRSCPAYIWGKAGKLIDGNVVDDRERIVRQRFQRNRFASYSPA